MYGCNDRAVPQCYSSYVFHQRNLVMQTAEAVRQVTGRAVEIQKSQQTRTGIKERQYKVGDLVLLFSLPNKRDVLHFTAVDRAPRGSGSGERPDYQDQDPQRQPVQRKERPPADTGEVGPYTPPQVVLDDKAGACYGRNRTDLPFLFGGSCSQARATLLYILEGKLLDKNLGESVVLCARLHRLVVKVSRRKGKQDGIPTRLTHCCTFHSETWGRERCGAEPTIQRPRASLSSIQPRESTRLDPGKPSQCWGQTWDRKVEKDSTKV